ncbi:MULTISPECIES: DUF1097 domain-containing protein [Rhizobium]|uniref:DUF1097 domain-containing protein n=1 Tax=Rhizobium TaxID=379 RepID=UPI001C8334CD|nr:MULTISPECIES: DUF1097 domain-containing protein [Rhizobium]MBX4899690.1 DUF1097 domain-containing protein [Rhizobium bangladeshense]MBX5297607.1 DUF1097 domain-containing protein [Rhizobium sp. NLR15a]MBY3617852.1 DUF1097 domain-containing protein [Rhizobium bangladeshense]
MSTSPNPEAAQPQHSHDLHGGNFVPWTLITSAVAALAAWLSAMLSMEVWVMFSGFIAWFTRPTSIKNSVSAICCLWLGILMGTLGHSIGGALGPFLGHIGLPVVVFAVTIVIASLRTHHVLGNMLAWFLGLVTYFAAEIDHSFVSYADLGLATALGGFAGYACQELNRRFAA